jgi:aryl-alcohol dehydrogenase-like predicted oxidoreductase
LAPLCREENIAVVPYQILQGGLLTGKYRRSAPAPEGSRLQEKPDWMWKLDDELFAKLEAVEAEAARRGLTMTQYAIRWVLEQPQVVSAIIGVKNVEQIETATSAC